MIILTSGGLKTHERVTTRRPVVTSLMAYRSDVMVISVVICSFEGFYFLLPHLLINFIYSVKESVGISLFPSISLS